MPGVPSFPQSHRGKGGRAQNSTIRNGYLTLSHPTVATKNNYVARMEPGAGRSRTFSVKIFQCEIGTHRAARIALRREEGKVFK